MKVLRAIGALALAIVALPVALVAGMIGFKGRNCTPEELASELNELASGDMRGWDRLECVRIKDPGLEAIRKEAMVVNLPFQDEDRVLLGRLAVRAAALRRA